MKIYSNGKDRVLTGVFPTRFKLLNKGEDVPFIRTGKDSIRLSGEIPFGELDVKEVVVNKKPKEQPKQLDAMYLSIINRADAEKLLEAEKSLKKMQDVLNADIDDIKKRNKELYDFESKNAGFIEQTNETLKDLAKVFGKEIQADRDEIVKTANRIKKDILDSTEISDAKLSSHETAKNPHNITKETIGLDKVDNTSDLDKPISKATQKALDKKADKSDIEDLDKKIEESGKKQDSIIKSIENANLYGGIGGNELPNGGKKGQVLTKKSSKTGDYIWSDETPSVEILRVEELPSSGKTNILYLVPVDDPQSGNIYDEYIWAIQSDDSYAFEKIGTTEIDLSEYVRTDNPRFTSLNVQYLNQSSPAYDLELSEVEIDSGEADYGFYYYGGEIIPENSGVDESYAYGKITVSVPSDTTMTVYFRQSSEQNYDFGELSYLDEELSYSDGSDNNCEWTGNEYDDYEGSVTYDLTAGEHFFTFKYIKDSSSESGDDTFNITKITIGSTQVKKLIDYDTQEEIEVGSTPGNGTITLQVGGSTVGSFTTNQSEDETINLTGIPTMNPTNNYVPYKASSSGFGDSSLMYNASAMAFTSKLHIGSTTPASYSDRGRLTIYDYQASTQVSSIALLNYGGGGGCGVAIDMYNTGANNGIPSGRIGILDNNSFSAYMQLMAKKSGAAGNPLMPICTLTPIPVSNCETVTMGVGGDHKSRSVLDVKRNTSGWVQVANSEIKLIGSGTTYRTNGSHPNHLLQAYLTYAIGDYLATNSSGANQTTITGISQYNANSIQITTSSSLGSLSAGSSVYFKKGVFKVSDGDNSIFMFVNPEGKFGVKTATPAYELDVNGSINASTDIKVNGNSIDPTKWTGYDATKTQTLKNVQGVLTWVDD